MLVQPPVGKATLHLAVLGLADCEINGTRVSPDTLVPGWSDYRFRTYYRSYDVTHLLRQGANAIGVTLGNGWYCGYVGLLARQNYGQHPLFALSLVDSERAIVCTDSEWHYNDHGPIVENDLLMGESYDARLELGSWTSPDYNVEEWHKALIADTPKIAVEPAISPAIRPQETITGSLVSFDTPIVGMSRKIFDFGQNLAGRVRLRVKGWRGLNFMIRHGEMLEADGKLHTANLRTARATDNYTCKGDGWEEWEPRFTFHGFRYCEISWPVLEPVEKKVELTVEATVLHSDLSRIGIFECSNPLLNQLVSNALWSQRGNFLDVPTDCPQRDERLGWTGDIQAYARTAAFFYDSDTFLRQWLASVRDAQSLHDGAVPPYAPYLSIWNLVDGGPGWGDVIFVAPWTAYLCYGDTAILSENFAAMLDYLAHIERYNCKDGIRCYAAADFHKACAGKGAFDGFGDWLAVDRQGNYLTETSSKALIGTAFHAHAAEITARTAEVLGEDAAPYWQLHARIVEAFRKNFLDENGRLVASEQTQAAHVLALHFHLVPDHARQAAGDRLVELLAENEYYMTTGFLATPYILAVLEDTGHLDTAYRLLLREEFPSWLLPVKSGATTIWERWNAWTPEDGFHREPENTSFNHYAYGAVVAWMVTALAGLELDPAEPAYRHIVFKPRPGGGITHARASLQTRHGHTAIAWHLGGEKNDTLHLTLEVPEGAYATLSLPPEYKNTASERIEPGRYELTATRA